MIVSVVPLNGTTFIDRALTLDPADKIRLLAVTVKWLLVDIVPKVTLPEEPPAFIVRMLLPIVMLLLPWLKLPALLNVRL